MEVYDEDLMGLLGGRKERRMQDVNGYQVYGAPQDTHSLLLCEICIPRCTLMAA